MANNVTTVDEIACRAHLKTELETMPFLGHVHIRRRNITSREDFVKKFGVLESAVPGVKIMRFVDIEFIRFEDSDVEGFDDCPVMAGVYGFHVFQEFFDGTDDANSNDDFIRSILELRDYFLESREFTAGDFFVVTEPLTMPEFAGFGNDSFTDATGHFCDVTVRANYYDEPPG